MAAIKTVLVGLGGIGTEIVDKVYGMIPEEDRNNVAVHGFDTDVNDIEKRKNLQGRITQISAPITVGTCHKLVKESGGTVDDWFPPLTIELARKPLTEGAAQIRAVSRLAYYYTILNGGLQRLERQLANIFQNRREDFMTTPRIVIVSSLAGGTGAGLFLQTALYLQDLLQSASERVITRGMFLLPDILIKNNKLRDSEHDTVRANAYACLKELDAITRNAQGAGSGVTIELEYKPNQVNAAGHQVHAIQRGQKPYDFCFLYDYENMNGRNLGELNHYKDQVVQALFLQFFTPIGAENRSQEDNNLRQSIKANGTNCYCSTGVARLVYPYEAMIEYFGLRWIADSLAEEWRWLDDQYEQEVKAYELDMKKGLFRERPKRGKRYVELLDSHGSGDNPHHFFRRMYLSTRKADEKGHDLGPKIKEFVDHIEDRVSTLLKQKKDFQDADGLCTLNNGKLKIRNKVAGEVAAVEDSLEHLKDIVFRVVQELKIQLVNDIIGSDCQAVDCLGGDEPYQLNRWMLREPEPVHPVAVRYMLYQLEMELESKEQDLAAKNKLRGTEIRRYREKMYDLEETEDYKETAEDRVRMALEQGRLGRMIKDNLAEFAKTYQVGAESQRRKLRDFARSKLLEDVYRRILESCRALIGQWERYFDGLNVEKLTLMEDIFRLERAHEVGSDPSIMFLLAGQREKQQAWEQIRPQLVGDSELPADICKKLYIGVFQCFCHEFFPWNENRTAGFDGFRNILLGWTEKILRQREDIRLNVIEALRRSDFDVTETIKTGLHGLALPLISTIAGHREAEELAYWGIHPDSAQSLTTGEIQMIFGGSDALRQHGAFSPYELIRYRVVPGLQASDLPKFKGSGDASHAGIYFTSYQKGIRELEKCPETAVTYHLDRRWHRPAYMPDLNPELARLDEAKGRRAFLLGLILKMLQHGTVDSEDVWALHDDGEVKTVQVNGRNIAFDFFELYQSMPHNPIMVDKILAGAEQQFAVDKRKLPEIEDHQFIKGCAVLPVSYHQASNVLDIVLIIPIDRPADNLMNLSLELLDCLLNSVTEYCIQVYGKHQQNTAQLKSADILEGLRNTSKIYQKAEQDGSEYLTKWCQKIEAFVKRLRQGSQAV